MKLLAISRQDVFNQREHRDALPPEPDFRGIDPRHLQELGSQTVQMVRLLVDESGQFDVIRREASTLKKSRTCRPYRRKRRLERVGERVENRRPKLLGLARRFGPAFFFEGTRALQGNGRQRRNRDDRGPAQFRAAERNRANRLRPQPQGLGPRVSLAAFQRTILEIGVARELVEIVCLGTGRVHASRRSVEERHGFCPEDLLNERHDLRPDRLAAIEEQNTKAQFVELLDLHPLTRLCPCLFLHACGKLAHGKRGDFECSKGNPVLRVGNRPGEHWRDKEIIEATDSDQRRNAGFPETPDNRNHHHNQEVERAGGREVKMQPKPDERH